VAATEEYREFSEGEWDHLTRPSGLAKLLVRAEGCSAPYEGCGVVCLQTIRSRSRSDFSLVLIVPII
jgi:hypothetical protein